jgi:hypothetical protein
MSLSDFVEKWRELRNLAKVKDVMIKSKAQNPSLNKNGWVDRT